MGYSRQSSGLIVSGHTVVAADLEAEFSALATAFGGTGTGHTHDGSSSQGALISLSGSVTGTLGAANGGTGVANNAASTLTISGNFGTTLTVTGTTALTLPTSGTLVSSTVTSLGSLTSAAALTTVGTIGTGVWNGTGIGATYGGTGSAFTQFSGAASTIKTYTLPNASCNILTDNALVTAAQGGTANGFFAVSGPASTTKTFTLPNASATILTDNAQVTGAQGGTGVSNSGKTITLGGNLTASGAFATTVTATNTTSVTLPTTGTVLSDSVTATLGVGYATTPFNAGTKSSGTFTPAESNGAFQYCTNGGAHTLAPPTNKTNLVIEYTNNGSAGAITTSGFTKVDGSFDTTNAHKFLCYITKHQNSSYLNIVTLQ